LQPTERQAKHAHSKEAVSYDLEVGNRVRINYMFKCVIYIYIYIYMYIYIYIYIYICI
jgi:hypothetical protein